MTIRECIEQSANVCTVKKFTEITPTLGFKYLTENFNLTTLDSKSDIVQAACLGGISKGVYNIEMTAAYAAIANGGVYTEPVLYTKIYDHDGNLLFEKHQRHIQLLKRQLLHYSQMLWKVLSQTVLVLLPECLTCRLPENRYYNRQR